MTSKRWAYEDFAEGVTIPVGSKLVTAEEVVDFARQFDMQPMHLDEQAGKASILGGLSASGWHTCAMLMRMICDAFLLDSTSQGAPGIDNLRWRKPVLAGDQLSGQVTVVKKRLSASRPNLGFVTFQNTMTNQRGQVVMEFENTGMFLSRQTGATAP